MYWWARQYPVTNAAQEAKVEKNTAVQAYQYFRDICCWRLLNHDAPLILGGLGVVHINSLGPIADISAQFAVRANDDSGYIRIIEKDAPFMAPVQIVERG